MPECPFCGSRQSHLRRTLGNRLRYTLVLLLGISPEAFVWAYRCSDCGRPFKWPRIIWAGRRRAI